MQVEGHNLTIIATEVSYVKPQQINTLYFMAGERYDFVIDTNNMPVRDYFIRIRQLIPCHQELQGFAVLRYHQKGSSDSRPVLEFNDKPIPTYVQEYPNGTVRFFKFLKVLNCWTKVFSFWTRLGLEWTKICRLLHFKITESIRKLQREKLTKPSIFSLTRQTSPTIFCIINQCCIFSLVKFCGKRIQDSRIKQI